MTTSYELSLRLKELGVEQENGEYYWVRNLFNENEVMHNSVLPSAEINFVLCRAFTLGELVRMLPNFAMVSQVETGLGKFGYATDHKRTIQGDTPEEAAGGLLAEIKSQEKQKEG